MHFLYIPYFILSECEASGNFGRAFEAVSDEPDMEWLAIDATVILAKDRAAGAPLKRGPESPGSGTLARWVYALAAAGIIPAYLGGLSGLVAATTNP